MNTKKLFLFSAVALATCFTIVKAQNADDIITKHIAAMGGPDKWNMINSMKLTGSSSAQGMEMGMTQTIVNNKGVRMDISAMGMNGYFIITPTEGWMFMPPQMDKPLPMPQDQVAASQDKMNTKFGLIVDKSDIARSEYIGMDTINSVNCYKIKITDKSSHEQVAFFDAASYYMLRMEAKIKMQDVEQEVAINYGNYQKQPEGIMFPMTIGSPQGDFNIKTVEINKPVDESIFKPGPTDGKK